MTERAPGTAEQVAHSSNGLGPPWPIGRRRRCCEEAREEGKLFDRTDRIEGLLAVSLGHVVGNSIELASRGFVPLGLKELVGDTHLDVVRLAGEQQERLVLGLPAKTGDRAVIAVVVRLAGARMAGEDDARLADGPVEGCEGWNGISRALLVGKCNLRIHRRAGSTECRMEMATAAAAEVHRRSEAVGDLFLFREVVLASAENRKLSLGQS